MNEYNDNINNELPTGETPPTAPAVDLKKAKKDFSTVGLSLCALLATVYAVIFAATFVLALMGETGERLYNSPYTIWILNSLPMYCVAVPVALLILRKAPSCPPERRSLSFTSMLGYVAVAVFVMNVGNYIGVFLSMLMSNGTAENAVSELAMDTNPLKIVVMVILAPFFEELVFRKQLIDRTRIYGEKTAVMLSAILFALFHTNMFQFFYAFFVGIVFGYIYIKSGKLRYTVIIHVFVNFMGSVVAPFVVSKLDTEMIADLEANLETMTTEQMMAAMNEILPGLLMYLGYSAVWGILGLAGLIIYIVKKKTVSYEPAPLQLPAEHAATTVYMNLGIVLYIIITAAMTILSVLGG